MNVNMKLISDGDVSGVLMVTDEKYKVNIFSIGGGPEGVWLRPPWMLMGVNFRADFFLKMKKI